ncbi:Variable outer membrane protein (plasmid) [Borrelia crocidurae DOU]|uniref:Variable large protein n=1 Tax=Borrelia crocidurae DOU TaxID=1293575 RepID=W5SKZ4_9SPIR|nr:variable large family protein [Borrelia crocidurae]AHH07824.1 Variable outer membrane protein [Borrelia crocidurae DOU]
MKREKEVEGKGRVKVVIIMVMMVMGCNSGGVKDAEKVFLSEMVNLGKGFLDVFVSFGDMITETLGIKADTKKSEIGEYFSKIAETMKGVREKLGKIMEENGNYEKVKEKVEGFIGKISKIEEGAKEASIGAVGDIIGNAIKQQDAEAADIKSVNSIVKGIKEIVGVVLQGEGDATSTKTGDQEKKSAGGLFATNANDGTELQAAAASATIGAVTGADILQAIAKSGNADVKDINTVTNAAEIAVANKNSGTKTLDAAKIDAVIAGGIALRAMAKDGKFVAKTGEDKSAFAINGAVASVVNKVLSTLMIAIRNTVDEGLKEINKVLGEIKQREGTESKAN